MLKSFNKWTENIWKSAPEIPLGFNNLSELSRLHKLTESGQESSQEIT